MAPNTRPCLSTTMDGMPLKRNGMRNRRKTSPSPGRAVPGRALRGVDLGAVGPIPRTPTKVKSLEMQSLQAEVGQVPPTVMVGKGPEMPFLRAEVVPAHTVVKATSPEMLCLRGRAIPVPTAVEVGSLEMRFLRAEAASVQSTSERAKNLEMSSLQARTRARTRLRPRPRSELPLGAWFVRCETRHPSHRHIFSLRTASIRFEGSHCPNGLEPTTLEVGGREQCECSL